MAQTKMKMKTFDTRIDLNPELRAQMIELINRQLADTFDLFSQTKQAHWNVKGEEFIQLHELYDMLAGHLIEFVDTIAERATALGGMAMGTVRMAAGSSRIDEYPVDTVEGLSTVQIMAERFANLAASTRQAIEISDQAGDLSTSDMFTEISRQLDKDLWFLEAHLQSKMNRASSDGSR